MSDNNLIVIVVVTVIIAGTILGAVGIYSAETNRIEDKAKTDYELIEIEGMTCVIYKQANGGGLSCNWAEWEGR